MISAVLNISHYLAAIILMILIAAYVYFGGMKGASISGLWKAIIIWITLFIAGTIAFTEVYSLPNFHQVFSNASWFDLLSIGPEKAIANLFAIVGGVVCSQTYIQALFSASDSKTASIGAISAAIITIPVGLPSIAIAMFMHVQQPDLVPMLVLPVFLIQYLNPVLGGIALGGIFLSIISSTAGQALSVGTLISKDIFGNLFNISNNIKLLWINRICILLVAAGVSVFSVVYINSQILDWNYLSMALRGGGIFLPLTIAIFKPRYLSSSCALWAMILSTIAALVAKPLLSIDLPPVFIGTLVSGFIIIIGIIFFKKHNDITIVHN